MKEQKEPASGIQHVSFRPPEHYVLDLEVLTVSELRRRVNNDYLVSTHRIEFHMLIYVTAGSFNHIVDFKTIACGPGSLITLRPAQVHRFDTDSDWEGWLVIFKPEFLQPLQTMTLIDDLKAYGSLETLPSHQSLDRLEAHAVKECINQMYNDAHMSAQSAELHSLLRHQLYSLLLRLYLIHGQRQVQSHASPANLHRFRRFQQLLEQNFSTQQQVADYAKQLGCSEKSLTRTTLDVAGISAKAYISSRINLEAKRLLAQTALPIATIAERVGFEEATNFVKFFKREVGYSPGEFRRQQEKR